MPSKSPSADTPGTPELSGPPAANRCVADGMQQALELSVDALSRPGSDVFNLLSQECKKQIPGTNKAKMINLWKILI
jgi:hypothetical protein